MSKALSNKKKLNDVVDVVADFGADPTGVADSTAAINVAGLSVSSLGGTVFFPAGTYKTSTAINLYSNVTFYGTGSASVISCTSAAVNVFYGTGLSECVVRDLKIVCTATGTTAYIGGVSLDSSNNCSVRNVEFSGLSWAGVYLNNSNYCEVRGCWFHGWAGTVQDSADVCVYRASTYNVIDGNYCFGGGYHGILVQEPGGSVFPRYNTLSNNRIGLHTAYGITQYQVDSADAYTVIEGNHIQDISGSATAQAGSAGAGIYINNSGAVTCSNNTIKNCCTATSNTSLSPAGIGINNIAATMSPVVVSGNVVVDIVNYYGIEVVTSSGPVVITGNSVRLLNNTANSSIGIYVNGASNVAVTGNNVQCGFTANTTGISVNANSVNTSNVTITGNVVTGCSYAGIRTLQVGGFSCNNICISGNTVSSTGAGCNTLFLANIVGGAVTGNSVNATTVEGLYLNAVQSTRFANNYIVSSGSVAVTLSGTNTGSYFDKTNYTGTVYTKINNTGTGLIVEYLGNAIPAASNWAVGDRVEQSVPVVGQPKGWRCTVAGAPGTWVSEGNL